MYCKLSCVFIAIQCIRTSSATECQGYILVEETFIANDVIIANYYCNSGCNIELEKRHFFICLL